MEQLEDDSVTEPDIYQPSEETSEASDSWPPPDVGRTLQALRDNVTKVLAAFDIEVLSDEELRTPVPWLEAGEEVLIGVPGRAITVREAFFFQGL